MNIKQQHITDNSSHTAELRFKNIYFIGIGGIGMSALARYFLALNKTVMGYDKTPTGLTNTLASLGVTIHFKDDVLLIDKSVLNNSNTLVVYTPAVPKDNKQLNYFKDHNYTVLKRAEVLGIVTKNTYCLAVAGTHGKTTTSSILAHLLYQCHVPVTAFLGGISENYNSNFIQNGTAVSVVEADEFDRSFLALSPNLACITSMDADHLDIYKNAESLHEAFSAFSKTLKNNGKLFIKAVCRKWDYLGIERSTDYSIKNIRYNRRLLHFDIKTPQTTLKNIKFNLPGRHNLLNALVAMAMALEYGCPADKLSEALARYTGVKRRFSYQIKSENLIYIDGLCAPS